MEVMNSDEPPRPVHASSTNPALKPSTLPVGNPTPSTWITSHKTPIANHRSTTLLPTTADITIIGTGISAVFAARPLLQSPRAPNILILEARDLCSGATGRNGGHLQPLIHEQAHRPDILDFELANFEFIARLIDSENVDCDFRRVDGVVTFWSAQEFNQAKAALGSAPPRFADLVEVIDDSQRLAELGLRDGPVGAIVQHTAATLSPYKLITSLWSSLLKSHPNLNIQSHTLVSSLAASRSHAGSWELSTPRGTVTTSQILLATNGYTSALLPQFAGLISPVRNGMIAIPADEVIEGRHSHAFFSRTHDGRSVADHVMQMPRARAQGEGHGRSAESESNSKGSSKSYLMFGGGRAYAMNNAAGISDDSMLEPQVEKYLRSALPRLLNVDVNASADEPVTWAGIMGYSRDRLPWIGGVPTMPGVWVCGGYSGHGMPLASGCAAHVAELMTAYSSDEVDWRVLERANIDAGKLPAGFEITESRVSKARGLDIAGLGARI